MNKFIGIGRLTEDPSDNLRYTPGGTAVLNFTIAINRSYDDEKTDFIDCVAWRKTAENMANYLEKGRKIAVEGEVRQNTWEDDNGNQRSKLEVNAANVQFLDYGGGNENQQDNNSQQADESDIDIPF